MLILKIIIYEGTSNSNLSSSFLLNIYWKIPDLSLQCHPIMNLYWFHSQVRKNGEKSQNWVGWGEADLNSANFVPFAISL